MWSDECLEERGKEGKIDWVWGHSTDKWKPTHVQTYKKGKGMRVMVSAAFWGDGQRSDLLILERDFESKRYSANSYLALKDLVVPNYTDDLIFMQDNASIYTAKKKKKSKEWLKERGIRVTDWPPYSPDLNPIEHAWK